MTITLRPEQEKAIQQAIESSGLIRSVDDLINTALASLPHRNTPRGSARRGAIQRMREFGDKHPLSLGEPITRMLMHEGHRY